MLHFHEISRLSVQLIPEWTIQRQQSEWRFSLFNWQAAERPAVVIFLSSFEYGHACPCLSSQSCSKSRWQLGILVSCRFCVILKSNPSGLVLAKGKTRASAMKQVAEVFPVLGLVRQQWSAAPGKLAGLLRSSRLFCRMSDTCGLVRTEGSESSPLVLSPPPPSAGALSCQCPPPPMLPPWSHAHAVWYRLYLRAHPLHQVVIVVRVHLQLISLINLQMCGQSLSSAFVHALSTTRLPLKMSTRVSTNYS